MSLIAGLGCRRGCPAGELLSLLQRVVEEHGLALSDISALASIDLKQNEPGLLDLAQQLERPLVFFSAAQLAPYRPRLSHQSAAAFASSGCYGVAESAALALAEQRASPPANLRVSRQKSALATVALASAW